MTKTIKEKAYDLIVKTAELWADENLVKTIPLPESGSERQYFRLFTKSGTAIGVFNPNTEENKAFIDYTHQFQEVGLNVPKIILDNSKYNVYIIEDMGDTPLLDWVKEERKQQGAFTKNIVDIYEKIIHHLVKFQVIAGKNMDYSNAYPVKKFDSTAIRWDLNYFKYYFLKPSGIQFNELSLEKDFETFASYLCEADNDYFCYRDFQARNILLYSDEPWFVDYQGGRKGPLQYDLASLLYQASADIPDEIKLKLIQHYLVEVNHHITISHEDFLNHFYPYVLLRILQTLGAYGFRGLIQKKQYFIDSIPPALENLEKILSRLKILDKTKELSNILNQIISIETSAYE